MTNLLFTPFQIGPLTLANRVVGLPMYLAYPDPDHFVNELVLDYYAEMGASGEGLAPGACGAVRGPASTGEHERGPGAVARWVHPDASGSERCSHGLWLRD